jgi:transposase
MVFELTESKGSQWEAMQAVQSQLGLGSVETLRKWVRRAEIDGGRRAGASSEELAEVKRLRKENAELRRANEILKSASAFFAAAELDRLSK